MTIRWRPTELRGRNGIIYIDATYFGRNNGDIVVLETSGEIIYVKCIKHDKILDYVDATEALASQGYRIDGIVVDEIQQMLKSKYPIQMRQHHMAAIIRRKLTQNPRTPAGKELKASNENPPRGPRWPIR